jgi:hypothetical protein
MRGEAAGPVLKSVQRESNSWERYEMLQTPNKNIYGWVYVKIGEIQLSVFLPITQGISSMSKTNTKSKF